MRPRPDWNRKSTKINLKARVNFFILLVFKFGKSDKINL